MFCFILRKVCKISHNLCLLPKDMLQNNSYNWNEGCISSAEGKPILLISKVKCIKITSHFGTRMVVLEFQGH